MVKKYEIMTIAKSSLGEDKARTLSNLIKDLITKLKGKVLDSGFWGKRKFAYEIKHDQEGFYEVIEFEIDSDKIGQIKNELNFMEDLVRYLISAA